MELIKELVIIERAIHHVLITNSMGFKLGGTDIRQLETALASIECIKSLIKEK